MLGIGAWAACLPRLTTLASLLYFMGAFVASTIWPIAAGLYLKRASSIGASVAMLTGTILGLISYFMIGFYVAALVSAVVSMISVLLFMYIKPDSYSWQSLNRTVGAPA